MNKHTKSNITTVESESNSNSDEERNPAGRSNPTNQRRYFKVIDETGEPVGRYTGTTPKQAASKAFAKMVRNAKENNVEITNTNIILRESTRGSNRNTYGYVATREKLDNPVTLQITNANTGEPKNIVYRYKNNIRKTTDETHLDVSENKPDLKSESKLKSESGSESESKLLEPEPDNKCLYETNSVPRAVIAEKDK